MIPKDAEKPADLRRENKQPQKILSPDLADLIAVTTVPMPPDDPDVILDAVSGERIRLQYESELAYLRGDFQRTLRCYKRTEGDDAARLRACPAAIAASVMAELALATVAVSVIAPNMAPDWLKNGDFSALTAQLKPDASYLRAKYFLCIGNYEAALAVSQTALSLSAAERGIVFTDIYLRVTCAVSCFYLGRVDEARRWLLEAMKVCLPHGRKSAAGRLRRLRLVLPGADAVRSYRRLHVRRAASHSQIRNGNIR